MNFAFFHSTSSRSASAARRSRLRRFLGDPRQLRRSQLPSRRAIQPRRQNPMHDQIRIPPDRRREVRVTAPPPARNARDCPRCTAPASATAASDNSGCAPPACPQSSPPASDNAREVISHLLGQLNLPPHLRPVAPALRIAEPLHRNRPHAQRVAEVRGNLLELHHALRVRLVVDAEDRRARPRFSRCAATASFAASMNSSMSRCAMLRGARDHAGHLPELVELNQRLGHIEIDRPALDPLPVQHQRQFPHQLETAAIRRR